MSGVSSAAINDSVACGVKLVVEQAMLADGSVGKLPEVYRQKTEIFKSGPGIDSLWLAVNGSVAAVVKYVVDAVFSTAEEFFSGPGARSLGNKRDEFLKSGPRPSDAVPRRGRVLA